MSRQQLNSYVESTYMTIQNDMDGFYGARHKDIWPESNVSIHQHVADDISLPSSIQSNEINDSHSSNVHSIDTDATSFSNPPLVEELDSKHITDTGDESDDTTSINGFDVEGS